MSSIASLEAELAEEQRINYELSSELSMIASGVSSAHSRIEQFNSEIQNKMNNSLANLEDSTNKLAAAVQTQAEIEELYVRFKAMELANKRVRDCNNRIFYDFANYSKVRKLVQGIMDNLDLEMASDRIIYKSVERSHLATPDYWLTCVLLSIMAWRNDDKALADRAMGEAMRLDKKHSAIFYMLFNLRMKREEAAMKWFLQYQGCDLVGADQRTFLLLFALISKTINSSGEVSETYRYEIERFIRKVVDDSTAAAGYSAEDMISGVRRHLKRFVPRQELDYPSMRKYCTDFSRFTTIMMNAKSNIEILQFLKDVIHVPLEQRNDFINVFIMEIISAANDQEKSVYEEIEYNETIIRMEGDVDKAKKAFGRKKIHDEKEMNLIYEMIEWVFGADKKDVNGQSRLNMFTLTKGLQQEAVSRHIQEYRRTDRIHSQVKINEFTGTLDFTQPVGFRNEAVAFYEKKRDDRLAEIKALPAYIAFALGVAVAVASFFTTQELLILSVLAIGFGVAKLLLNKAEVKHTHAQFAEDVRLSDAVLRELLTEYQAYEAEYQSYDAYVQEIGREFALV